jgi:cellulose synthase/poly-beta-1,6-N-acetylglucosamine synthase-like glycosyltransferase
MHILFFASLALIAYPYAIYPALLVLANRLRGRGLPSPPVGFQPEVSIILPVHNEAGRVAAKVHNLLELDYPADRLEIIVVGDGCTDDSLQVANSEGRGRVRVIDLPDRAGKAAALNAGVAHARGEICVFTDAGILLEPTAFARLVGHFADPGIGCVSGEDRISEGGGEGLYARLEMLLRREEARLASIAGASGCYYAQRKALCTPFTAGMAPDFLSVLNTVRAGQRAICEPEAVGYLTVTPSMGVEYNRKVRTFLRGITALFSNAALMNPFRYPAFSFILLSHKLMRWLAPAFMVACLVASWVLRAQPFFAVALGAQLFLYGLAALGYLLPRVADRSALIRLCTFFLLVNVAALKAFMLWAGGRRQEIWEPTRRPQ